MTDKADWLAGLKVGDEVVVQAGGVPLPSKAAGTLDRVERLTKTQIVTESGARFRRDDGYGVRGGVYHREYLEEPTDKRRAAIRHDTLAYQCKGTYWKELPLATLETVVSLLTDVEKLRVLNAARKAKAKDGG